MGQEDLEVDDVRLERMVEDHGNGGIENAAETLEQSKKEERRRE